MSTLYEQLVDRMIFWRRIETGVLSLLIILIPLLSLAGSPIEVYAPTYAGVLAALVYSNRRRMDCRHAAREEYEHKYGEF